MKAKLPKGTGAYMVKLILGLLVYEKVVSPAVMKVSSKLKKGAA
jgi:hypothetical protein